MHKYDSTNTDILCSQYNMEFLLRKIALPYPHKCLLGFVEAKRGDKQEYLKIILVREVNPVVSDSMRTTHCRLDSVERSSFNFWSSRRQHVKLFQLCPFPRRQMRSFRIHRVRAKKKEV